MADPVQRLESGRTQLAGVSSLPQPNMNFGQQRPELEFQAQADYSTNLSRVLSNLSSSMFGQAERLATAAGEEFVLSNPQDIKAIQASIDGDTANFKRQFSINAFSTAVNSLQGSELAAGAEIEYLNKVNTIHKKIQTRKNADGSEYVVDTAKIAEELKAQADGWSSAIAQYSTDGSYKFRATAAVRGNEIIKIAAKAESERAAIINRVKVGKYIDEFRGVLDIILKEGPLIDSNTKMPLIDERTGEAVTVDYKIREYQKALINRALALGGIDAATFAAEAATTLISETKLAYLENAVNADPFIIGGDRVKLADTINNKNLPANLQSIYDSLPLADQKKAKDMMLGTIQANYDNKTKDRAAQKFARDQEIAQLSLEFVDKFTIPERLLEIEARYRQIIAEDPSVASYTTLLALKKAATEDAVDDPVSVGKLKDLLMDKDASVNTNAKILDWASTNGVTAKTALQEANRYLPKEKYNVEKEGKLLKLKFHLETKKPYTFKSGRPRAIATIEDYQSAIKDIGLSLQDVPESFVNALTQAAKTETSVKDYATLLQAINNNSITDPMQVYEAIKANKYIISDEKAFSLMSDVEQKNRQLQSDIRRNAGLLADTNGTSTRDKARRKKRYEDNIQEEIDNARRAGNPIDINEATRIVEERENKSDRQKKIVKANSDLTELLATRNMTFSDIQPANGKSIFTKNEGSIVEVTKTFEEDLITRLRARGASQGTAATEAARIIQLLKIGEQLSRENR
jgi:hypothetical protein